MSWKPRLIRGGKSGDGARLPAGKASDTSDAELVHRVLSGLPPEDRGPLPGHDAFAVLVERHQPRVLRLAWHLTRDSDDARDVAQDAFLRAYRSLASFRPERSFRNWLLAITVNAASDHRDWRGHAFLRPLEDAPEPADGSNLAGDLENAQLMERIRRCTAELTPREREVFVLRDLEGLDVDEVGAILELEPPTVRRHLARARLRLRELLGPVPGGGASSPEA